jgi:hypothetical protein
VENIYFPETPPSGTYQVWVVNYDARTSAQYTLQVFGAAGGQTQTYMGFMQAVIGRGEVYQFTR